MHDLAGGGQGGHGRIGLAGGDDGGVGGISTGDYRLDILAYHDDESGTNLVGSQPVLCASCHASPTLGTPGQPGVKYLSHSMHEKHAGEDGVVINTMAASWLHSTGTLGAPPRNELARGTARRGPAGNALEVRS